MPKPKFMTKRISAADYARLRNVTCKICRRAYYASQKACPFCPPPAAAAAAPAVKPPPAPVPVATAHDLDELEDRATSTGGD